MGSKRPHRKTSTRWVPKQRRSKKSKSQGREYIAPSKRARKPPRVYTGSVDTTQLDKVLAALLKVPLTTNNDNGAAVRREFAHDGSVQTILQPCRSQQHRKLVAVVVSQLEGVARVASGMTSLQMFTNTTRITNMEPWIRVYGPGQQSTKHSDSLVDGSEWFSMVVSLSDSPTGLCISAVRGMNCKLTKKNSTVFPLQKGTFVLFPSKFVHQSEVAVQDRIIWACQLHVSSNGVVTRSKSKSKSKHH